MMRKEDAKSQHIPKRRAMSVLKDKLKARFKETFNLQVEIFL